MKAFLRETLITLILAVIIFFLLQATVQSVPIIGSCMVPNIHDGQRLLINKIAYTFHPPERGDIITLHPPNNPEEAPYIKRIIGLPGETIEIKMGTVYINDSPLDEPYIKEPPNYTYQKDLIPDDSYFVLGDNRNNANDSHLWGTVPRQNIIGKAWLSIWPLSEWGLAPNYSFPS